jgi:nitrogen fixation protein NifU and related proteins
MFSSVLLDHFQNPRNSGDLPDATTIVDVSNPVCGDALRLAAILQNGRVSAVRFLCRGCAASIACASRLTEEMLGREVASLRDLSSESLAAELGGLPEASRHAAQLAVEAMRELLQKAHEVR